jgi:hypothetical protein
MSRSVKPLETLAGLVLDHELARLRAARAAIDRSRDQLQAINAPSDPGDLPAVAAGLVEINYRRWADIRRAELNALMARQTVTMIETRGEAAKAFGRLQALRGVAAKLAERK